MLPLLGDFNNLCYFCHGAFHFGSKDKCRIIFSLKVTARLGAESCNKAFLRPNPQYLRSRTTGSLMIKIKP